MQQTWVQFLGWEDPLEEGLSTHSSILAWRSQWTEEPEGIQATGSQRVRHNWRDWAHMHIGPVTIFLVVLGLSCVGLSPLLCFLPREVPLMFVGKMVWWCWILLTLLVWKAFYFSINSEWELASQRILVCRFFPFITLNILCVSFWLVEFLLRNQLITWWEFPCMLFVIFPLMLLIFYLCL